MREEKLRVEGNRALNSDTFELTLLGNVGELKAGGFVEVKLPGFSLRRPFGVAYCDRNSLTIIYRVAGLGTKEMIALRPGDTLDVLLELGNGFTVKPDCEVLLFGGGIGAAPLYLLAKRLSEAGCSVSMIFGARSANDFFYREEFEKICKVYYCTDDGSLGTKGNVLDTQNALKLKYDYYCACGPEVMLRALAARLSDGEISLEARMGCGFGACMGCSVMTKDGAKRVCKEGPVFRSSEVIFDA